MREVDAAARRTRRARRAATAGQRHAERADEALHVARPRRGGRRDADPVFEDQIPADDPGDELAQRRIRVGIRAARDRHHRREFRITQRDEDAGQPGQRERRQHAAGPAAFTPAPIVVKMPPSIVPRPTPIEPGTPSTRRSGTPPAARSRSCGCVATSRCQSDHRASAADRRRAAAAAARRARARSRRRVTSLQALPSSAMQRRLDDVGPERTAAEIRRRRDQRSSRRANAVLRYRAP